MNSFRQTNPATSTRRPRRGFTLVELLVVVAIILVLITVVLTVSSSVLDRSRAQTTRTRMQVVDDAIKQFHREPPTWVNKPWPQDPYKKYSDRYGVYPPDEMELFTDEGLHPNPGPPLKLARPLENMNPPSGGGQYAVMKFERTADPSAMALEHRDFASLYLALKLYDASSFGVLEGLPESAWSAGPRDDNGQPTQFYDRDNDGTFDYETDEEVRYVIDAWKIPLGYMAQRDWDVTGTFTALPSSNHATWNQASSEMVRLNGGSPIVFSWGPDGADQLSGDFMKGNGEASLVNDWVNYGDPARRKIDHPNNEDNVYLDDGLKLKLEEGVSTG